MGSVKCTLSVDLFPKVSLLKPSITPLLLALSVSEYFAAREHWLSSKLACVSQNKASGKYILGQNCLKKTTGKLSLGISVAEELCCSEQPGEAYLGFTGRLWQTWPALPKVRSRDFWVICSRPCSHKWGWNWNEITSTWNKRDRYIVSWVYSWDEI